MVQRDQTNSASYVSSLVSKQEVAWRMNQEQICSGASLLGSLVSTKFQFRSLAHRVLSEYPFPNPKENNRPFHVVMQISSLLISVFLLCCIGLDLVEVQNLLIPTLKVSQTDPEFEGLGI